MSIWREEISTFIGQVWKMDGGAWAPVSEEGLGDDKNWVSCLEVFDGNLYAGTSVGKDEDCEVWRYDGSSWKKVRSFEQTSVSCMKVYDDGNGERLFCGMGGEVWAYDGSDWKVVADGGLGDTRNTVASLEVYSGRLYLGTSKDDRATIEDPPYETFTMTSAGCELHVYDGSSWGMVAGNGFGNIKNGAAYAMEVYDGALYIGTFNGNVTIVSNWDTYDITTTVDSDGFELYRLDPSGIHTVLTRGLGDTRYNYVSSLEVYDADGADVLVLGAEALFLGLSEYRPGCRLWAFDGQRWYKGADDGWGNPGNYGANALLQFKEKIYGGTYNVDGAEVWYGNPPVSAPPVVSTWYLAEGCTNGGFETWILVQNPNDAPATANLTYMTGAGAVVGQFLELSPNSRTTVNAADMVPGEWNVSTKVEASAPVIAERSMYGNNRTWGHDSIGVMEPAETWYLAEGCTRGGMETWILVQNSNDTPANIKLNFMTGAGPVGGPGAVLEPNSRRTFYAADTVPEQWSVSTMVTSDAPVIAERSMYGNNRTWGHDSIGVMEPAETWYLAEGCTRGGMETWILVQNPNDTPANIKLNFMTGAGPVGGPGAVLEPNSRRTFYAADTVPEQWSVSTMVTSDAPVIAER
ncbi:MAG: hypothetical protein KJ907_11660, partial [Actinobacteria bacterium]|nr:hypothetical protein [Actinomycetota bacterium]